MLIVYRDRKLESNNLYSSTAREYNIVIDNKYVCNYWFDEIKEFKYNYDYDKVLAIVRIGRAFNRITTKWKLLLDNWFIT